MKLQGYRPQPRTAALGALLSLFFASPLVGAEPILLLDLFGQPDVRREAGIVGLHLMEGLQNGEKALVPRNRLAQVIDELAGKQRRYALVVQRSQQRELMKRLRATTLLSGRVVRDGTGLEGRLYLLELEGDKVKKKSFTVKAAHGALATLGHALATKAAAALGIPKPPTPTSTTRDLLPFVEANIAQLEGKPQKAMRALLLARRHGSGASESARAVGALIAKESDLSPHQRVLALLASGAPEAALEAVKKEERKNKDPREKERLRAASAIVHLAQHKVRAAKKALGSIKGGGRLVTLARARLFAAQGKHKRRDALLLTLLGKRPYLPALSYLASNEGRPLSKALLTAAFQLATDKVTSSAPALRSAIALRAALRAKELGISLGKALQLVRPSTLGAKELSALIPLISRAEKQGLVSGHRLRAEIALRRRQLDQATQSLDRALEQDKLDLRTNLLYARVMTEKKDYVKAAKHYALAAADGRLGTKLEHANALRRTGAARELELNDEEAAELALANGVAREIDLSGGASSELGELKLEQQKLTQLIGELGPLLDSFPTLVSGAVNSVVIAPLAGGAMEALRPFNPERAMMQVALLHALKQRRISASSRPLAVEKLSSIELRKLTLQSATDGALLFRMKTTFRGKVELQLVLFSRDSGKAHTQEATLPGRSLGLVSWNQRFVGAAALLGTLLLFWIVFVVWRGTGTVRVTINLDPLAQQPLMLLKLSRFARPPRLGGAEAFAQQLRSSGAKKSRFELSMAPPICTLPNIPRGTFYVHLVGVYSKDGLLKELPANISQKIKVRKDQTTPVVFELEPTTITLSLTLYDKDRPLRGVKIWLGDESHKSVLSDSAGAVSLQVARNKPTILHASNADVEITRKLRYDDTRDQRLSLNFDRERKHDDGLDHEWEGSVEGVAEAYDDNIELAEGGTAPALAGESTIRKKMAPTEKAPPDVEPVMPSVSTQAPETPAQHTKAFAGADNKVAFAGTVASTPKARSDDKPKALEARPTLSRYERLAELGRGAMGVVYKARDTVLEREVALKVIGDELKQYPEALKLFAQEAKALAALNHPNVVTVFDQAWQGEQVFMVMELVEGTTLEDRIEKDGALSLVEGLEICDQLCAGLAYAHERQVIHRDIKPENVFVSHSGAVKLGDFGLAKVLNEIAIKRTEVRGTPLYMSPEQIRGTDIDFRADLYAVGCTMFEIFTGRPPFIEGEILYHHMHTPPPSPLDLSTMPSELSSLILSCIEKEKEDRIASADEIRKQLKPLLRRFS